MQLLELGTLILALEVVASLSAVIRWWYVWKYLPLRLRRLRALSLIALVVSVWMELGLKDWHWLLGGLPVAMSLYIASGGLPWIARRLACGSVSVPVALVIATALPLFPAGAVILHASLSAKCRISLISCKPVDGGQLVQVASPSDPLVARVAVARDGWYALVASPKLQFYEPLGTLYAEGWKQVGQGKSRGGDCASVATWLSDRMLLSEYPRSACKKRLEDIMLGTSSPATPEEFCREIHRAGDMPLFRAQAGSTMEWKAFVPCPNGDSSVIYDLNVMMGPTTDEGQETLCPVGGDHRFSAIRGGE